MKDIERIQRQLALGQISRRDFMTRMAALGVAAATAGSLASSAAWAAGPKRGGTFRLGVGHGATTDSMDPATFNDTYMQTVGYSLRNCLTELDHNDKLQPELAESWESSPDAKEWTFKLRKGVEFHNGKTLDADDVLASITHHIGEDSKSAAKGFLKQIASMKKQDANTVSFTLEGPNADFPYLLSDYHVPMLPSKDGTVDATSGVGTGGYTVVSFEPGVVTRMKHNPNYWKSGFAWFDEVEIRSLVDQTARTNALTSGQLDCMDRPDFKTVHLLAKRPGMRVEETQGSLHYTYPMLVDKAPFDNVDLRLALKYAVDRCWWTRPPSTTSISGSR